MSRVLRIDAGTLQKPRRTSQGYLRVDGWASRTGILEYRNPDGSIRRELREPDAVFNEDALTGFEGAPVTDDHPSTMVDIHNAKALTKGTVLSVGRRDGDHVAVSMIITDPDLIRKMESGKRQLSTGYYVELDETPGTHPQFGRYDARQVRVGPVNHLAVVDRGRAGTASVRMDAAMDVRLDALVPQEVVDRIAAIARRIDEWDESQHPRAENGQFGEGGGGGEKKAVSGGGKLKFEHGVATTEHGEYQGVHLPGNAEKGNFHMRYKPAGADEFQTIGRSSTPGGSEKIAHEHHEMQTASTVKTPQEKPAKRPTYAKAQTTAFQALADKGWTVNSKLKVPHATSPDGETRLWFKPQAVWKSEGKGNHSLKTASSTFDDLRDYGHSAEGIHAFAEKHTKR